MFGRKLFCRQVQMAEPEAEAALKETPEAADTPVAQPQEPAAAETVLEPAAAPVPAPAAPPPTVTPGVATPDEEAAEEKEVAELKEMMKRPANSPPRRKKAVTSRPMAPKPEWNATPHRSAPPALRGLKTNREPWSKDDKVYAEGMQGHGAKEMGLGRRKAPPSPEQIEKECKIIVPTPRSLLARSLFVPLFLRVYPSCLSLGARQQGVQ